MWPTNYANRDSVYLSEGGGTMRNAYGNRCALERLHLGRLHP
jgi:hypothetical protein